MASSLISVPIHWSSPLTYGTFSMTFMPMAEPSSCGSGFFVVRTSTIQSALRPSSVRKPKYGTQPAMEPMSSIMPELRLQRAPSTLLAYTTADDSAHESTSPCLGLLPTSSR